MSSSRKSKRDLTSRTVDFLNRVNSVNDHTSADPQSRSKPRVRRLRSQPINRFGSRTPQVPQGDAIWDIPSDFSEEETRPRRNAQTEPRSLRRSQRARKSVQVEDTPTRTSRRLARVIEDRHEQSSEEDDSEMEELDKIIDKQLGGARLIQSVNENRSADVNHGSTSEEKGAQEGESDRASEEPVESTSPSKKLGIQKSKTTDAQEAQDDDQEWAPDTAASEELGEEDDERGSATNRPPEPTHIIQTRRLTQQLASPRKTRRHTLAAPVAEKEVAESSRRLNRRSLPGQNGLRTGKTTRDEQGDRTAELSEVSESVQEESDPESSYEPEEEEEEEDEAGAIRHVPDTQREEPSITARPSKRRRTDEYQRNPQVEVLRTQPTPSPVHSNPSTPDDHECRRSSRHPSQSPAVAVRPINAISDDAQNEALVRSVRDNAGDKAWFAEASNLGQQKENWDLIVTAASELRENIDPSRAESFGTIDKQLSQLRTRYTKINTNLKSQQGPLRENLRECEDLREAILEEGTRILDGVYYLSLRQAESHELLKQAHRLVKQFEARVFPTIIKVILLCFEGYYTCRKLFPSAYRHLAGAMKLLLRFCDRIASLRTERYIRCKIHSRTMRKPLQELIKALEGNLLQRRMNETDGASRGEKKREWTEDEKIALLDGLKLFLGQDRYIRMVCHFGQRLRHRSLQELQTRAREIHDRFVPRIQEELRTVGGRRQWQWLLSVNDGQRPMSVD
ncbi:hypothetical protein IFM58399_00414 [Aspergillus lentulus]|uniref:Myb-like domain-containing protein n=1 Tax=Aspergillus lentulus TaxID=293939 RepID=A0ABQ1A0Z8_ASPLE|nr:uncharacterized protein IFM58399_00414 [Aspergillus lentulus]GFF23775.1 hypothetical protein IFM58399_00414 [Aspergillus lentulus]GFF57016.1 hypothetical protein IFM62136_03291 [Aspergillus lentulus]GFF70962.1 hypothetical protein IFM60648_03303 [Aspergillus lentulus]GFF89400.1 hypothetical protein IFM47457_08134 [Aspergillus lentulus]